MKTKGNLVSLISVIFILLAVSVPLTGCMKEVRLTPQSQAESVEALPMSVKIEVSNSVSAGKMPIVFDLKQAAVGYFKNRGTFREVVDTGADVILKIGSRFSLGSEMSFHYDFDIQSTLQGGGKLLGAYHVQCSAVGGQLRLTSEADRAPMNKALTECLDNLAGQIEANGPTLLAKMPIMAKSKGESRVTELREPTSLSITKYDVDELPAIKAKPNKNSYAIVIGIEEYRQKLPNSDFSIHDAKTVTEYLTEAMGYPEENVVTLLNDRALKSDFEKYFEKWLFNNVEKDGSMFIYYSGHGAPNVKTGDAFLVPYDGDPAFIDQTGYSLKRLYDNLGKLPAKEIIVALDSCFSGAGGRSVIAKGARPLVMTMEKSVVPSNVAVLSASSGEQISSTYEEKGHGLFTYFMLKGLKGEGDENGDGKIEIGELFDYIKPQVERTARKTYNNEQSPQLIAPNELMKQRLIER